MPPIFMPDALPAATLPIYPGVGQAQEYGGVNTPWFGFKADRHCRQNGQELICTPGSDFDSRQRYNTAQTEFGNTDSDLYHYLQLPFN